MGSISEDLLDGTCCSLCGEYFEDPVQVEGQAKGLFVHGEPVVCHECWDDLGSEERKLHKKARWKTIS